MVRRLNRTAVSRIFRIIISLLVVLSVLPVLSMSAGPAEGDAEVIDGGTFFIGQVLWTDAYDSSDNVDLEDAGGTFLTDVPVSSEGTLVLNTAARTSGTYRLTSPDGPTVEFELVQQKYSVTASPTTVDASGPNTLSDLTISSNRADFQHVLTSPDFTAQELDQIFPRANSTVSDLNNDGTGEALLISSHSTRSTLIANFSGVAPGTYTINFAVTDTAPGDNVTFRVKSFSQGSANFAVSSKLVKGELGTVVDIPVTLRNTATTSLVLGSSDLNYQVRVEVHDGNDDGTVTVRWDTASAGQGPASGTFSAADGRDSVSATRSTGAVSGSLAPEAYPMNLSVDGQETDVATVSLQQAATSTVCGRDITPLGEDYNANVDTIPEFASGIVRDETIHGIVNEDNTRNYTLVTGSDKRLTDFRPGVPNDAALAVETDCVTLTAIIDAEDSVDRFTQAYDAGEVNIRGIGLIQSLIVGGIELGLKIVRTFGIL